jgi:hypothetical protein
LTLSFIWLAVLRKMTAVSFLTTPRHRQSQRRTDGRAAPGGLVQHSLSVCDAGINRQRRKLIAAVPGGTISFREINLEPQVLAAYSASLEDMRRRLRVTGETGRLLVGADVAIAVCHVTASAGWPYSWATPRGAFSRASSMTVSSICFRLEPACGALVGQRNDSFTT